MSEWPALYRDPIIIYRGDTVSRSFSFKNPDGTDMDLSSWTDWRATSTSGCNLVEWVVDPTNLAQGKVTISCGALQTSVIREGGDWDIQSRQGSTVRTWIRGTVKLVNDVTR